MFTQGPDITYTAQMTFKSLLIAGSIFWLPTLVACGSPKNTDVQDLSAVEDATLSIETTYGYGGQSGGCKCDDGTSYGSGGASNLLTNDGNSYAWQGCRRGSMFEGDPNRGTRCSTSGEYTRAIEPNTWPLVKKEILRLRPQTLAGNYRCDNKSIPCPSDVSYLQHDITINGEKFTISWESGIYAYLPPRLQQLNTILQSMDPPWHD